MTVGGTELGGEIDVATELEHAVVVTLEDGLGLFGREVELLEIFRLARFECLAVLFLHERHAEHVYAISLPGSFRVKDKRARDVVIIMSLGHKLFSDAHADGFPKCNFAASAQWFRSSLRLVQAFPMSFAVYADATPIFIDFVLHRTQSSTWA